MTDGSQDEDAPLPPCSISSTCQLSVRGIADDVEWKDAFVKIVTELLVVCGRMMDLTRLDGVTVGFDYGEALESVDLGYESSIAKQYTNQDGLVGVGKMLRVIRDAQLKAHVVLNANVMMGLVEHKIETEEFWAAGNIVAHELAHVEVMSWFEGHSPGILLAPHQGDWATSALRDAAHTIWEEYAACRLSAPFSRGERVTTSYAEGAETSVLGAIDRARDAIKEFRTHGDVCRLLVDTSRIIAMPLKMSAYLMGHLDGLGQNDDLDELCPWAGAFGQHFHGLRLELRAAWDTRTTWSGLSRLDPIVEAILDALKTAGVEVILSEEAPGSRIQAPFSAATLPNGEADMAIIRARQALGLM